MSISTLKTRTPSFSTLFFYILGTAGVLLIVIYGGQLIKNWDNIRGSSAINVQSYGGEAEVYINNEKVGVTPYESQKVKPGENTISIFTERNSYETTLDFLGKDDKQMFMVTIMRDLGISDYYSSGQEFWYSKDESGAALRIISDPPSANIYMDKSMFEKTPFTSSNISEGRYEMTIEYPGYEPFTTNLEVKKGYLLNVSIKMFPLPVPIKVKQFEGSQGVFDLSTDKEDMIADPAMWARAVKYWNETRGIDLEGAGLNKDLVFDYMLDYKGNMYTNTGEPFVDYESLKQREGVLRIGYLGRSSDNGLTQEASNRLKEVSTKTVTTTKVAEIGQTPTGWLRVRSEPGLEGLELTKVNVGEQYPLLEESQGWAKIQVNENTQGWVSGDYIQIKEVEENITNPDTTPASTEPATN